MMASDGSAHRETTAVVEAFLDAFDDNDFEGMRVQLAGGFVYDGPLDHFSDPDSFVKDLEKYGQVVRRIERRRLFVDGDEACVILTFVTTIQDIERTRMAMWLRVEDGKIARIEGFLDPRAYVHMFREA
jgi:ketosteroid isomerase-like protein